MVLLKPVIELTLFAPSSEDPTETAILAQLEDPARTFVVTTRLSDSKPYLTVKSGRRGRYDPRTKHTDTGSVMCSILNKRETGGGDTLDRFYTRFFGNAYGRIRTNNVLARFRRSDDGGVTYEAEGWFTGRVYEHKFVSQVQVDLEIRDLREDLNIDVFTSAPSAAVSAYAQPALLLPSSGLGAPYGDFSVADRLRASTELHPFIPSQAYLQVDLKRARSAASNLVTDALREALKNSEPAARGYPIWTDARVRLEIIASSNPGRVGQQGEFLVGSHAFLYLEHLVGHEAGKIGSVVIGFDGDGREFVKGVGITELNPADPAYLSIPEAGDVVDFVAFRVGPPTKLAPIYIDTIKIATLKRLVLEGHFGRLDDAGNPRRVFPFDAVEFASLEADPSASTGRFAIDKPYKLREFLEKYLCLPHELGYRINGDGEYVPFDTRFPKSLAGIPAITVDDIALGANAVQPVTGVATSLARVLVKHYYEIQFTDAEIKAHGSQLGELIRDLPATRIKSVPVENETLFDRFGELTENSLEIDAIGLRAHARIAWKNVVGPDDITGHTPEEITRRILQLVDTFRSPNVDGPLVVTLKCRRTANVTSCHQGMLRIVNHPGIPNAASKRQGGNRLMRCLERSDTVDGLHTTLLMLDLGADVVAVPPAFATLALNADDPKHSIDVALTLNALSENAAIPIAITDQTVAVRPLVDDPKWSVAASRISSGAVTIVGPLPARRRIWFRAHTNPLEADAPKLPSDYVFPAGAGYIDTQALAAPSDLAASVNGRSILLQCTNNEPGYPLLPLIAPAGEPLVPARDRPLPPGSDRYVFEVLDAGAYDVGFKVVDPYGGDSVAVVAPGIAVGVPAQLQTPREVHFEQASITALSARIADERSELGVGFEISARLVEENASLRVQLARDLLFTDIVIDRVLPLGQSRAFLNTPLVGTKHYGRALQTREGFTDSEWSSIASGYPTILKPSVGLDRVPGVSGDLELDPDRTLRRVISTTDPDTDGAYYQILVTTNPDDPYPSVDELDVFVDRAAMPSSEVVLDGLGNPIVLAADQIALMTVRGFSRVVGLGSEVYARAADRGVPSNEITQWLPVHDDVAGDVVRYVGHMAGHEAWVYEILATQPVDPLVWDTIESPVNLTDVLLPDAGRIGDIYIVPPEGSVRYVRVRPYRVVGGQYQEGPAVDVIIYPKSEQAPVIEQDHVQNGEDATLWIKIHSRGIDVTSVEAQTEVGTAPVGPAGAPDRIAGAVSIVRGGVLGANEYEHDATLDTYRRARILYTITLATGEIMTVERSFDWNRVPDFAVEPWADGTLIRNVAGDDDTVSLRVARVGSAWKYEVDSFAVGPIDVALADPNGVAGQANDTVAVYRISLFSDPIADIDTATFEALRDIEIRIGATGEPEWSSSTTAAAPLIGSDVMTIKLQASAAPVGYTSRVWARHQDGGSAWSDWEDITADLAPALVAPPTVLTDHTYATAFERIAKDVTRPIMTFEIKAEILDGLGAVVATATVTTHSGLSKQWYRVV